MNGIFQIWYTFMSIYFWPVTEKDVSHKLTHNQIYKLTHNQICASEGGQLSRIRETD